MFRRVCLNASSNQMWGGDTLSVIEHLLLLYNLIINVLVVSVSPQGEDDRDDERGEGAGGLLARFDEFDQAAKVLHV